MKGVKVISNVMISSSREYLDQRISILSHLWKCEGAPSYITCGKHGELKEWSQTIARRVVKVKFEAECTTDLELTENINIPIEVQTDQQLQDFLTDYQDDLDAGSYDCTYNNVDECKKFHILGEDDE